jgi:hypothetical protein
MTKFDTEEFLRTPIYAFDFQAMIGDILDFLDLSEKTIEWQHRAELQRLRRQSETEDFPEGYLDHLITNADHRFTVSLPMRLRFACLVSLCTTVEWEARLLSDRAALHIGKRPKKTNETVHTLARFDAVLSLGRRRAIDNYADLVTIRNAIVHAGGIERDYEYPRDLSAAVSALKGFSISRWHFFGPCVKIERGALEPHIEAMAKLIPAMWKEADKRGLLRQ